MRISRTQWPAVAIRWISQHFILPKQVWYQLKETGPGWHMWKSQTKNLEAGARDTLRLLLLQYVDTCRPPSSYRIRRGPMKSPLMSIQGTQTNTEGVLGWFWGARPPLHAASSFLCRRPRDSMALRSICLTQSRDREWEIALLSQNTNWYCSGEFLWTDWDKRRWGNTCSTSDF